MHGNSTVTQIAVNSRSQALLWFRSFSSCRSLGVLEVRAEGSRRGFSEPGRNEMKLTKRSLILLGARAMLLCKREPRATAKAASRAKSHPARQRSGCRACTRLLDATLLKEIGGDAMMHPPKGGRAPTIHPSYHTFTRLISRMSARLGLTSPSPNPGLLQ